MEDKIFKKQETIPSPEYQEEPKKKKEVPQEILPDQQRKESLNGLVAEEKSLQTETKKVLATLRERIKDVGKIPKILFLTAFLNSIDISTSLTQASFAKESRSGHTTSELAKNQEYSEAEIPDSMEISEQQKLLEQEIGILKKMGCKIKVDYSLDTSFVGKDFRHTIFKALSRELGQEADLENNIVKVPDRKTRGLTNIYTNPFSTELHTDEKPIDISPFALRSKRVSHDRIMLELYHRLPSDKPVLYSKMVTEDEIPRAIREITNAFGENFDEGKTLKALDKIPPAKELPVDRKPVFSLMPEKHLSQEAKETLRELEYIQISTIPEGRPVNVKFYGQLDLPTTLEIPKEKLKKIESPIAVNGSISEIILKRKVPIVQKDKLTNTINNESRYTLKIDTDGTIITKTLNEITLVDENGKEKETNEVVETLFIDPPIKFKKEQGREEDKEAVSLNLSSLRVKDLHDFLFIRTESPLTFIGKKDKYGVYTNMDHETMLREFEPRFPSIEQGVARADYLFGIPDKEKNEDVYIVTSDQKNAISLPNNPKGVVLFDKYLQAAKDHEVYTTSFHERIHGIDRQFNLSGGNFALHFQRLKQNAGTVENICFFKDPSDQNDFLENMVKQGWIDTETLTDYGSELPAATSEKNLIVRFSIPESMIPHTNEQNFFSGMTMHQGHGQERSEEFLSSFLNTFNYNKDTQQDDWENRIMALPKIYQRQYLETVKVLKSHIQGIKEIPQNAPIFKEIENKINFFKTIGLN